MEAPNKRDLISTGQGAPLAVVLAWAIETFVAPVPVPVAAAMGAVITGVVRWLTRRLDNANRHSGSNGAAH